MQRREFISLLGGAAAAWPLAARAQQPDQIARVGMLQSLAADDPEARPRVLAFERRLQEMGWTDGHNMRIDYRWALGDTARMRTEAAELVSLKLATHLLLSSQLGDARAAGRYDREWIGSATSTVRRCKPANVTLTVQGRDVSGQARFEVDAPKINGNVWEDGTFGATIGWQPLTGKFSEDRSKERSRMVTVYGKCFCSARSR
jgi:hypothetical protein